MNRVGRVILYVVYFGLVIVLAGFITHALTNDKTTPPKPTHTQAVATAKPAKPQAQSSKRPSAPASKPTTTPTSSSSSAASPALANSGPGDVLAVFIGTSLVGTIVYRQSLISRFKQQV